MARERVLSDIYLTAVYKNILQAQMEQLTSSSGRVVEIGSAGGITNIVHPEVETSDIRPAQGVSLVIDAGTRLPFEDASIKGLISKDVLHHIPQVKNHFQELSRVLAVGGRAVYAEPNWNYISRIIFRFVHPEPWLPRHNWEFVSTDPMFANQALPWIIFVRDVKKFVQEFPNLEIAIQSPPLNGLSFLISGGVLSRTRVPSTFLLKLSRLESRFPGWLKIVGLTRIVVVTKVSD